MPRMGRLEPGSRLAPDSPSVQLLLGKRSRFLGFVRLRVRDPQAAEDILQLAYLRLFTRLNSLRDFSRASAWFFRILRNLIADHYRSQHRHPAPVPVEAVESLPAPLTEGNNTCPCASRALERLNPAYAKVLRAVDLADRAVAQYARESNISENNAAVRLHRARRALRSHLVELCGACYGAGCFDCRCA